jgi:hypothetical protein
MERRINQWINKPIRRKKVSDDKYYNGKLFNMCTDAELNDAQQEYWELMHDG